MPRAHTLKVLVSSAFAFALVLGGCNCENPDPTAGLDGGAVDDGGGTPGEDASVDAGTDSDGGMETDGGADAGACVDLDNDGFGSGNCAGPDCDDADPALGADGARTCYSGPPGSSGVGVCQSGMQSCAAGVLGSCAGEILPAAESCDTLDNDCDGAPDQGLSMACYTGPGGTEGIGACTGGMSACTAGMFGGCMGQVLPAAETCDNLDNDCDGSVDGISMACYSGPSATQNVGICKDGTELCTAGVYGACVGEQVPLAAEVCGNGKDDDCDGTTDETTGCALDTYVCTTCAGSSDNNPGTQTAPVKTISRGILHALALGKNKVFVANQSATLAATYAEDLTMVEGVSVEGRWTPGASWARTSTPRTIMDNTAATGVKFPAGITRGTALDGFNVRGVGATMGANSSVGITITQSSPTLNDLAVIGTRTGQPAATTTIGISVTGTALALANPSITGTSASARSQIQGGVGAMDAFGIFATFAELEGAFLEVRGGAVTGGSTVGVRLSDSPGSTLAASQVRGGGGPVCIALLASGAVEDILVEGSDLLGCEQTLSSTAVAGAGVAFDGCTVALGAANPRVRQNSFIGGGLAGGGNSGLTGVSATRGCPVEITGNSLISGGGPRSGTTLGFAAGVYCSFRSNTVSGADSACVVKNNASIVTAFSSQTTVAVGVSCDGSCATSNTACAGSCAEISGNDQILAGGGGTMVHVQVLQSNPAITQNYLGNLSSGAGTNCTNSMIQIGLQLQGSASSVVNNMVTAGACQSVVGYSQINAVRSGDMSFQSPTLHSNTIVGGGGNTTTVAVGASLSTPSGAPPDLGTFRNNIFVGGSGLTRVAFSEQDAQSDPALLHHNNFFNFGPTFGAVAYRDENTTNLATAGQINALTDTQVLLNRDDNPVFVVPGFDHHIQGTSPMRNAGGATGAPLVDIDGDARPTPAMNPPDIGADEIL